MKKISAVSAAKVLYWGAFATAVLYALYMVPGVIALAELMIPGGAGSELRFWPAMIICHFVQIVIMIVTFLVTARLFRNCKINRIFVKDNSRHFRRIGILIFIHFLVDWIERVARTSSMEADSIVFNITRWIPDIPQLFIALAAFYISHILNRGIALTEEADLTI